MKHLFFFSCFLTLFSAVGFLFTGEDVTKVKDNCELLAGNEYADRVLGLLRNATKRIHVTMFVMSYQPKRSYAIENKYVEALIDRYKKGVDVKVVLDAGREWSKKRKSLTGPMSKKNAKAYNKLKKAGVPVLYDSDKQTMHGKTILIDDILVIGSTNWTYSALKKNAEFSMLLKYKKQVAEMSKHFNNLWKASKNKEIWKP